MAKELPNREIEEEKHIRTVLEDDINFNGVLKFNSSLKIKGKFTGEVNAKGDLYIGSKAIVMAKNRSGR